MKTANPSRLLLGSCLASMCFLIASWHEAEGQALRSRLEPRSYAPRHERIAASILKRKQAMQAGPAVSPVEETSEDVFSLSISDSEPVREAANTILDAPPVPLESDAGLAHPAILPEDSSFVVDVPGSYTDDVYSSCGPEGCEYPAGCPDCGPCDGAGYCWMDSLSVFGGVHGTKNQPNRGLDGSFGFHEGVNVGWPGMVTPLSVQLGIQVVHSNFNGATFTNEDRTQYFITGGIFKRAYHGLQGGVVYDYLRESWYSDTDLGQVRGEFSWAWPGGSSLGFQFATSVTDDSGQSRLLNQGSRTESWETRDWYTAFYRVKSNRFRRGEWRLLAGLNGNGDGLVGSDVKVPMVGGWSLEPSFMYMIPDETTVGGANFEESWNVAINLVWYPGCGLHGVNWWHRPLFDVADNGSMIIRRQ